MKNSVPNTSNPSKSDLQSYFADDLVAKVRNEASELRNFTITFLTVLIYIATIVSTTTHEQLLRVDPVNLPLLNAPIPIKGFYVAMPWLIVIFHIYVLVQHYLLSKEFQGFQRALKRQSAENKTLIRNSLGPAPFIQWRLGGHSPAMQALLCAFTILSLVMLPLALLWWMQAIFLPYHSEMITLTQQSAILIDVLAVLWIWPKALSKENLCRSWWRENCPRFRVCRIDFQAYCISVRAFLLLFWSLFILVLSWMVSVTPDSTIEKFWLRAFPNLQADSNVMDGRKMLALTAYLHERTPKWIDENSSEAEKYDKCPADEEADQAKAESRYTSCRLMPPWLPRNFEFRNHIITAGTLSPTIENILKAQGANDDDAPIADAQYLKDIRGVNLEHRDLNYADFKGSFFPHTNLRHTQLKFANLEGSNWEGADFTYARLAGTDFTSANLAGATFINAWMPKAQLFSAYLHGAKFRYANLQLADLRRSEGPGSDFRYANLRGAELSNADIRGADFRFADLIGANLTDGTFSGADMNHATLIGAQFKERTPVNSVLENVYLADNFGEFMGGGGSENFDEFMRSSGSESFDECIKLEFSDDSKLIDSCADKLSTVDDQELELIPSLQTKRGGKELAERKRQFQERLKSYKKNKAYDKGEQGPSVNVETMLQAWVDLACGNNSAAAWIAPRMLERAKDYLDVESFSSGSDLKNDFSKVTQFGELLLQQRECSSIKHFPERLDARPATIHREIPYAAPRSELGAGMKTY